MNPEILERVLSCQKLPSLPAVAMRVVELTSDKNVNLKQLAETITNDQALAGKVLKTVNSSFYGLRKPCSTISQAIVMLGLSAVKTLTLGFSLVSSIAKIEGAGFDLQSYWRRSLLAGIGAKCFAHEAHSGNDEECFLGGLLQDVGQVAMYIALSREYTDAIAPAGPDHHQVARLELGEFEFTHADIGAMLCQRWRLPNELIMPVKYHERPTAAPVEFMKIVKAVALGNIAADVLTSVEPAVALKRLYEKAEQWLAIKPHQVDDAMKRISQGAREVARFLSVDAGAIPSSDAIMHKATEQLRGMQAPFDAAQEASGLAIDQADLIDPATGLAGRRGFNQNVITGFEQGLGLGSCVSVAILAIDAMEEFASGGKNTPDEILKAAAAIARPIAESHNAILCRYDALRMGLFMHNTDRQEGTRVVEQIRTAIGTKLPPILARGTGIKPVTMSAGLATLDESTRTKFADADALVTVAERALESAQKAGRNVLRVYVPRAAAA